MEESYISTENMILDKGGVTRCSSTPKSGSVNTYEPGDILISNIRPYFKKIWCASNKGTCSTDVLVFRPLHLLCSSEYLYYVLSNDAFFNYMMATSKGTKMPRGDRDAIMNYDVDLPPLKIQKLIVDVLSPIDKKISINRLINDYLVEIAQELFTEQFGAMLLDVEPPAGWKKGHYDDIIMIHDSKRIPLSGNERENMDRIYPYYGAASVAGYVDNYIFDGIYLLFGEDGTVIDEKGNPSLQYVWGKFWVNNHAHILTGRNGFSVESLFLLSKQLKVESIITGAVQPKISQNSMKNVALNIPPEYMMSSFDEVIAPIFDQYRNNCDENQRLSILRDTLLPKLMSREIDISNLDLGS
jgi:type I restriction enzyme S subunit